MLSKRRIAAHRHIALLQLALFVGFWVGLAAPPTAMLTAEATPPQVSFDVPAVLAARTVEQEDVSDGYQTIQVDIPVSLLWRGAGESRLEELLIAVYWSSDSHPVVDYYPQTTLATDIDGTIKVKENSDRQASIGVDGSGSYPNVLGIKSHLQVGGSSGQVTQFERKPAQSLLAASGSIKRGAGVYFKFRTSTQTTLEGTHPLSIQFQVPRSWRAGLIRVDCQARETRSGFSSLNSPPNHHNAEFISAVHLAGDQQATALSQQYVKLERRLARYQRETPPKNSVLRQIESLIGSHSSSSADWYRDLVFANSDRLTNELREQLPTSAQQPAKEFVTARRQLKELGR